MDRKVRMDFYATPEEKISAESGAPVAYILRVAIDMYLNGRRRLADKNEPYLNSN
ncbi:MAG TPA: hypothetical protein VFQ43_00160 [Nitrososphaera sp.]|nr:hypothetical protein [Nitrososphaera sp.]